MKGPVNKVIRMPEQFPEWKMKSSGGSFKANLFEINEFPNQLLKK